MRYVANSTHPKHHQFCEFIANGLGFEIALLGLDAETCKAVTDCIVNVVYRKHVNPGKCVRDAFRAMLMDIRNHMKRLKSTLSRLNLALTHLIGTIACNTSNVTMN